jgi:uncharacterized protein YjiK
LLLAAGWSGTLLLSAAPLEAQKVSYDLAGAPAWRAELPPELSEISGLAFTEDGRLLAHGDEQALIYEFDVRQRELSRRFGLAGPAGLLTDDFEDIEVVGERVFLVTSDARIYETRMARDGATTEARRRTRGLGGGCEVEGMTWDEPSRSLLLLCKSTKSERWKDHVVVLAVSPGSWRFEPKPRMLVPEARLRAVTGAKSFNGSAIVRHPRTGTYIMVAGPQRIYAEVSAAGEVLAGGPLQKARHRQPEGIAVAPDLTLLISDEAAGDRATITAYANHP